MDNIHQYLIELLADFMDSEYVEFELACNWLSDPEPREKTELHIEMADAAFEVLKKRLISTKPLTF